MRDDIRGCVAEHQGDPGGMLVVDETGDLKKGSASAGVQRQYTGTAGRVENCQVAVFLSYAAPGGHALIDRELDLPESWTGGPARCAAAGIPGDWYDWAWVAIDPGVPGHRHLLIRRHRRTRELAYYRCYSPRHVPLAVLVAAAGRRWMVEEDFQASKGLAALDEHQVRRWTSWYRWVTLAMLTLAFLTIAALTEHAQPSPPAMIPLTRNEIARLAIVVITQPGRRGARRDRGLPCRQAWPLLPARLH